MITGYLKKKISLFEKRLVKAIGSALATQSVDDRKSLEGVLEKALERERKALRGAVRKELESERKAMHWIVRKELDSERSAMHWIVRRELESERNAMHWIVGKELESERNAMHWIVRKELESERKAMHWIVRNELQKSNSSMEFMQLAIAREESLRYVDEHFGGAKGFRDKYELRDYLLEEFSVSGLVLEFGVHQGESISQIASKLDGREVHGFDSFDGLPEDWRLGFDKGHFSVEGELDVPENVTLIKGLFADTLPEFLKEHQDDVALLHVDCDLYSSTKTIFELLAGRLKPNTIILFDEYYNYPGWQEGEFLAFQEYVASQGVSYEYIYYNLNQCQVAVRILG